MKRKMSTVMRRWIAGLTLLAVVAAAAGCGNDCAHLVTGIRIDEAGNNALKVQVKVTTSAAADVHIEYRLQNSTGDWFATPVSKQGTAHKLVLTNLQFRQPYVFRIVTAKDGCSAVSKEYTFTSPGAPLWLKDMYSVVCPDTSVLPAAFKNGYMLLYKRDAPGILSIIDYNGDLHWYHQVNGTGFKTATFTQNNTILAILGTAAYQTSYGNEILELSLAGDTVFHLKKGEAGLQQTIHHEILLNNHNQVVTICADERILDLSARGGSKADTVKSDGIIVLDKKGNAVWKWSVFDALNPLDDASIVKDRNDWMHANSLCLDTDGNYLLSFYNNGQIWKIDAHTGKVIWKFGKGGEFAMPEGSVFDNSHAIHLNSHGALMLFDNGTSKQRSRTLAFTLDAQNKKATLAMQVLLPPDMYSERMGSAYLVNDTAVLQCCSKRNVAALTNLQGRFLWALKAGGSPYRVNFLHPEQVRPYIGR
ncbi:aryl-sulfate sulfotransferase [Deminuibacter soli]|uniref:Fibronectin type-III domain-containing protein n=1 Tax=Deminuibacter soli TaxID=2291815 RepID=A0A3E1NHN3_9BACT|nr:aryl-sulfate sulfotransferase [Deminuibacter soli]RFM27460.1 hypothetical protein DXN05_15710 [Deminuibacter soli]